MQRLDTKQAMTHQSDIVVDRGLMGHCNTLSIMDIQGFSLGNKEIVGC